MQSNALRSTSSFRPQGLLHRACSTGTLLQVLVQDLVYEDVIVIHRDLLAQLLSEGQSDGIGLSLGVFHAAIQVRVVETLPSAQPVPTPVKAQPWHQDEVQTS